jgi:hypothetical protein
MKRPGKVQLSLVPQPKPDIGVERLPILPHRVALPQPYRGDLSTKGSPNRSRRRNWNRDLQSMPNYRQMFEIFGWRKL